jgi:hypothetical protein
MSNHEFYEEEIGRINYIYEEEIARLKSKGYDVCVIEAKDTLGHENDYLYMWKEMEDGKSDWIEIGPVYDQNFLYGKSFVIPTDKNGVRIGPHVASLTPIRPLTHPPEQAPSKISPPEHAAPAASEEDKKWETLEKELVHYKTDGSKFRAREISGGMRLLIRKKVDGKWKDHYIGSYRGRLKKLCAELGIKVAGKS